MSAGSRMVTHEGVARLHETYALLSQDNPSNPRLERGTGLVWIARHRRRDRSPIVFRGVEPTDRSSGIRPTGRMTSPSVISKGQGSFSPADRRPILSTSEPYFWQSFVFASVTYIGGITPWIRTKKSRSSQAQLPLCHCTNLVGPCGLEPLIRKAEVLQTSWLPPDLVDPKFMVDLCGLKPLIRIGRAKRRVGFIPALADPKFKQVIIRVHSLVSPSRIALECPA